METEKKTRNTEPSGNEFLKVIGLISDTHVPAHAKKVPPQVYKVFEEVDLIIHAGDLTTIEVVEQLSEKAKVIAVHGNMDSKQVCLKFPSLASLNICGWKIGVVHDAGVLFRKMRTRSLARKHGFNVLVYGHIHHAKFYWEKDILYINPGSPTFPLPPFFTKPTVALLKLNRKKIEPRIVRLKKKPY